MFGCVCTPIFLQLSFPSFFVSVGMRAYLGFRVLGVWPVYFVSDHFL